jgi:hypothetical protein
MTSKEKSSQISALTARADIPTIFIDGYHGISYNNGVVRINLTEFVDPIDPVSGENKRVVARLALGLPALYAIYDALGIAISDMKDAGISLHDTPPTPDQSVSHKEED